MSQITQTFVRQKERYLDLAKLSGITRYELNKNSPILFQEPFEQMSDIFKEKLSSSEVAHLNRTLRKIDMDLFLPHLLEMILLNVKHAKENVTSMR